MITWLEKHRNISLTITIFIMALIFYLSNIPGNSIAISGKFDFSYIYHFSIFFLLNLFLFTTIKGKKNMNLKYFTISLLLSISYSILDEIHQIFTPFRNPSIIDILTDSIGILSSSVFYINKSRK